MSSEHRNSEKNPLFTKPSLSGALKAREFHVFVQLLLREREIFFFLKGGRINMRPKKLVCDF